jgi:hypothetical protein
VRLFALIDKFRDERGGVLVVAAALSFVVVMLLAFVVDVGHWYEHRRHLQLQVDAGALAAGGLYGECLTNQAGAEGDMEAKAAEYDSTRNPQVGGANHTGSVAFAYQSATWPTSQPSASPDQVMVPVAGQSACSSGKFDVKATESSIPGLLSFVPLATVRAHARVELRAINELKGLLPIAVPDTRFNYAFATFIDESTKAVLATVQLQKTGTSGGQQLWSSPATVKVPIGTASNVGVWIRLVGGSDPNAACNQLYVECYDADPSVVDATQTPTQGVVFIHGFNASAAAPHVANAWLLPGNCSPDAYFTIADCSAGIQAEVDLTADHPLSGSGASAKVWASVDGTGTYQLTKGSGTGLVTWTLMSGLPITGGGPHPVTLAWSWSQTSGTWHGFTCKSTGGNKCTDSGTFPGTLQRAFEATPDRSGSLQRVQILKSGAPGANSFQQGTSPDLGVSIATTGSLAVSAATDPIVYLRVTGSQNQSIDCDKDQPNLRQEIANGCAGLFAINPGTSCPAYNDLWNTPEPWDCVKTQTGGAVGQASKGMTDRIGSSCAAAPINWPVLNEGDPRIIPLIVTPFGSFTGSGNDVIPVIDFAAFYVMGWEADPCLGAGAVKVPKGYIAGRFIKYIPPSSQGAGDVTCYLTDPSQITPCVPVMTR